MTYDFQGDMLEVCDCRVLCPCWIGEDPDNGTCDSALAYRIREGTIEGIDVSGLVVASIVRIPGNVFAGGWRRQLYVDFAASPEQERVVIAALTGTLGGPLVDLAALIAEDLPVERAAILFDLDQGRGRFAIGTVAEASMRPYTGMGGRVTTLSDSAFSTIPGTPAYIAKAEHFRMTLPALGLDLVLEGHNAIQGSFRFQG